MTSLKQLLARLNQAVRPNMGNAMISLFLTLLCETLLCMFFAAPAMMRAGQRNGGLEDLILTGILLFLSLLCILLLQYGFHVLILRMTRREYVTIGYVFYGFKKIKQTLPLLLTIAVMVVVLTLAFTTGARLVMAKLGIYEMIQKTVDSSENQIEALSAYLGHAGIILGLYVLLLIFVFIRFAFVFYLHFDNPTAKPVFLLKKSAFLMHGNMFRLIRLVICAGGKNLIVAAVTFFLTLAIPVANKDGSRSGLSFVVLLLNFIYFVNAYTALLRIYFAFPVLYTDVLLAKIDIIVGKQDTIVMQEAAAFLASKFASRPDEETDESQPDDSTQTASPEMQPDDSTQSASPDTENGTNATADTETQPDDSTQTDTANTTTLTEKTEAQPADSSGDKTADSPAGDTPQSATADTEPQPDTNAPADTTKSPAADSTPDTPAEAPQDESKNNLDKA